MFYKHIETLSQTCQKAEAQTENWENKNLSVEVNIVIVESSETFIE